MGRAYRLYEYDEEVPRPTRQGNDVNGGFLVQLRKVSRAVVKTKTKTQHLRMILRGPRRLIPCKMSVVDGDLGIRTCVMGDTWVVTIWLFYM